MKTFFSTAITQGLVVAAMLMSGCTTYVTEVKKDERYTKRLTEAAVVWRSLPGMAINIRRSGGQGISEKDQVKSRKNVLELQALFAREIPGAVAAALSNSAVSVQPEQSAPATQLRITPAYAQTDCAPGGCQDSLWLDAQLFDRDDKRVVWSGRFKVGAPYPLTNDAGVVRSFADTLVSQLKSSSLL